MDATGRTARPSLFHGGARNSQKEACQLGGVLSEEGVLPRGEGRQLHTLAHWVLSLLACYVYAICVV